MAFYVKSMYGIDVSHLTNNPNGLDLENLSDKESVMLSRTFSEGFQKAQNDYNSTYGVMDVDSANDLMQRAVSDRTDNLTPEQYEELKIHAIHAAAVVSCNEMGIPPESIGVVVLDKKDDFLQAKSGSAARWEDFSQLTQGGHGSAIIGSNGKPMLGTVIVYKDALAKKDVSDVMRVAFHELGHANQSLKEQNGEPSINMAEQLANGKNGPLSRPKWYANPAERDADGFAQRHMTAVYTAAAERGLNTKYLRNNQRKTNAQYAKDEFGHQVWSFVYGTNNKSNQNASQSKSGVENELVDQMQLQKRRR
ncbi:MAG: hypothetical protein IJS74_00450 [Clostridia bacterium]|nr:hypothetical protein [Clostridia bacterium]